jgi:hypothetical protein
MIESRGREQEDKSQDTQQQALLAIKYEKDTDMHGNTLYPIESSKEPLPRYIKTPKEPILPRETHHTPTNIKGIEKETGVVKKEKSKLKHILGIKHGNIPIQLDLWGNEAIFRGKGQTTLYGFPRPER